MASCYYSPNNCVVQCVHTGNVTATNSDRHDHVLPMVAAERDIDDVFGKRPEEGLALLHPGFFTRKLLFFQFAASDEEEEEDDDDDDDDDDRRRRKKNPIKRDEKPSNRKRDTDKDGIPDDLDEDDDHDVIPDIYGNSERIEDPG